METVAVADAQRVNGHDHRLRTIAVRNPADQRRIGQRCGIDRDFVRAGVEHRRGIIERPDAAAHREWNEQLTRRPAHDIEQGGTILVGRGNIQQHNFIGARAAMGQSQFRGIAGVAQVGKLYTFHDASRVHVQAGDNALGQHDDSNSYSSQKLRRS